MKALLSAVLVSMFVAACTSPLELDVDRTKAYTDGTVHPKRLSMYYHFLDSAYEAIVTDTGYLNSIWIEPDPAFWRVTIPQLIFELPKTIHPSGQMSPFVHTLCFSTDRQPTDGVYRLCVNDNSWIEGEYLDPFGAVVPFQWYADDRGRQIRIAFYHLPTENIVKASIQVAIVDPSGARYVSYRALITMEY